MEIVWDANINVKYELKHMWEDVIFFENKNSLISAKWFLSWEGMHNQDADWFQRMKHLAETNKFKRKKCKALDLSAKYTL